MAEKMRVLLIEPLEKPKLVEIDHTLEEMQKLVGGYIQSLYPWDEDPVALVCCDTAKIDGYPANRMLEDYDIICGSFFICGLSTENFDSISDEMAEKYTEKFQYPEMYMRQMDGKVICFKIGSNEKPTVIA